MSEVGDLSFVVNDGVLSESYQIERTIGTFGLGGFSQSSTTIPGWGVVSVATQKDLEMIPEGDRPSGAQVFHSEEVIYETLETSTQSSSQYVSDVMIWGNTRWRVLAVWPYPNRNFWKAVAVRLSRA